MIWYRQGKEVAAWIEEIEFERETYCRLNNWMIEEAYHCEMRWRVRKKNE